MVDAPIIVLDWTQLLIAGGLIAVNAVVSIIYRLQMEKTLLLATARTVVQLLAVGYLLEWVFSLAVWYAVLPILVIMAVLAAQAAVARTSKRYPGVHMVALGAIFLSGASVLMFAMLAVVQVEPWWNPRYIIPILGMILGNSLTGISLALDRFLVNLVERRGEVELLLSHGGTRGEAVRRLRADAVRVGMIPIINSMMVVGTVSLPGMMTGQILSGTSPQVAVAYQIVIMFLLAAATALGSVAVVIASERRLFDDRARLLVELVE